MKAHTIGLLLVLGGALSGCAGRQEAMQMATTSMPLVSQFGNESKKFWDAQDALNKSIAQSVTQRSRDTSSLESDNDVQRASWQAQKNIAALEIYDALSTHTADVILKSNLDLATLQPVATLPSVAVDNKPFIALAADLKALSQTPTVFDQINFAGSETAAVVDGYKASLTKAAQDAANNPKTLPPK